MKSSKKPVVRFLLIAALTFGATWFLLPRSEAEFPIFDGSAGIVYEWMLTPEAEARTAAGECESNPERPVCLEECFFNVYTREEGSTGNFACFPDW